MDKKDEVISIRGNKTLWIKFVNRIREQRKKVWEVLELFILNYLKED